MTATDRTYTAQQALDTLTEEGYHHDDVNATIDSLVASGLTLDQPDTGLALTEAEVGVVREQLQSTTRRHYTVYWDAANVEEPGWVLRVEHDPDTDGYVHRDEIPLTVEQRHESMLDAAEEEIVRLGDTTPHEYLRWDPTSDGAFVATGHV